MIFPVLFCSYNIKDRRAACMENTLRDLLLQLNSSRLGGKNEHKTDKRFDRVKRFNRWDYGPDHIDDWKEEDKRRQAASRNRDDWKQENEEIEDVDTNDLRRVLQQAIKDLRSGDYSHFERLQNIQKEFGKSEPLVFLNQVQKYISEYKRALNAIQDFRGAIIDKQCARHILWNYPIRGHENMGRFSHEEMSYDRG